MHKTSVLFLFSALISLTGVGCVGVDQYPNSGGYGGYGQGGYGSTYPRSYDGDYERRRNWEHERQLEHEERQLEKERDRLERDRRRLQEQHEREHEHAYRPPPPPPRVPPPNMQERCPAGWQQTEKKCTPQERKHGCKDVRLDNGIGCVRR